jgi:uncharacterized protein (DUF302 family)
MEYYFSKNVKVSFDEALVKVVEELKKEGFGVLTEIDVQATLKKKLNVDFRKYKILGACNPPFAYQALQAEEMIGLMLPCNVIVQEKVGGEVSVAAIDPVASMEKTNNEQLRGVAVEIRNKLRKVISSL